MKFKRGTQNFSVYDNAHDRAKFLWENRRKLQELRYDPSINAKRVKDANGNIVREYLGNNAERNLANNNIIANNFGDDFSNDRYYKQEVNRINKGNKATVLYPFDPRTSSDKGTFQYHGYTVDKYSPNTRNININGVKYNIRTDGEGLNREVSFNVNADDPYMIVNKPENIKPLSRALYDQMSQVSPSKIHFQGADDGQGKEMTQLRDRINGILDNKITPDPDEKKFLDEKMVNGRLRITNSELDDPKVLSTLPQSWQKPIKRSTHKARQREMMYDRSLNQMFPGITKQDGRDYFGNITYDMSKVNYDQSRKNMGY